MMAPSFISLALVILLYHKVVFIRSGKSFFRKTNFDSLPAVGSLAVNTTESQKNNEAMIIIMMLSLFHFVIYAPFTLVYTVRGGIGFLFSSDVVNLLAGMVSHYLDIEECYP